MTRKTVVTIRLTEQQLEFLRLEAERLDLTVSEVVRLIIHEYQERKAP